MLRERPTDARGVARSRWAPALFWLGAAVYVGALYLAVRGLPFFSEDYTQLAWASEYTRAAQALSLDNEPLRPFQHGFFYLVSRAGDPSPAVARIPAFVMHLASAWLVFVLARELGVGRGGALLASALFLAFPNMKNLVWSAAIGSPGRVMCLLAALDLYLIHARTRTRLTFGASSASFVLALGFHESAIVLPVLCLLHALVERGGGPRDVLRGALGALRNPLLLSVSAATAAYVVYLAFLRPARHHGLRTFDGLPANVVKAAMSLVPESARALCVDGLRGHFGTIGQVGGALMLLALAAFVLWCLVRGSKLTRFCTLAATVDLVLPLLSTGFVQRYSYLGSAFLVVALAAALERSRSRAVLGLTALLVLGWIRDTWSDVRDYQTAGRVVERVLLEADGARHVAPPGRTIALVDVPDMGGREEDLPLFNWGLEQALARQKSPGPWLFLRTKPFHTSTSVILVTRADVERAVREGDVSVLEYRPAFGGLERR